MANIVRLRPYISFDGYSQPNDRHTGSTDVTKSTRGSAWLLEPIRAIHEEIRSTVVAACEQSQDIEMARVAEDGEGDTIYAVDRISESLLLELFEKKIAGQE